MPDLPTLGLFLAATAALLLVPGPSVLFIVARTLEHGRRGGLVSMLGVETGALLHVLAATAGLSALVAASPGTLLAIKLGGAAYLLFGGGGLGWGGGGGGGERGGGRGRRRGGHCARSCSPSSAARP